MRWNAAVLIVAFLGLPIRAVAQDGGAPWVAGRMIWDNDQSWNVNVPMGPAVGGAVGFDFSHRLGIEVAGDWPVSRTTTSVATSRDPVFGLERITSHVTYQSPSVSGALLIHLFSGHRIGVAALAGLAFVSHRSTYDTLVERVGGNVEPIVGGTYPWMGPVVGVQASISLGHRVAIVPEIRVVWFPMADSGSSTAIIRPAVGLRWTLEGS
jgi:hypothetical protein